MKRTFITLVMAVVAISMTACGSAGFGKGKVDSLSYAVGADLGLNLNFGMGDMDLDRDVVKASILDFYKNGDVEGEEIKALRSRMMEYQYTHVMPFMNAKRMQSMIETDCPDTLPALPALYDENFTREDVSKMIGSNMGAWIKGLRAELDMKSVMRAVDDGLALESAEHIDSLMLLTQQQMRDVFTAYTAEQKRIMEEERQAKLAENAEASAAWLAEVEKMDGVQKTESGLLYRIDREGTGAQATKDNSVVEVNYEGKTRDGKVFDSSYERGESISFPLNGVIKGWTEGMKLVKEGGQITLWIPSELAYGERGAGADIGPNEALEFKVELIKVTE